MSRSTTQAKCRRCGRVRRLKARGLDPACYAAVLAAGELKKYPLTRPRVDPAELARLDQAGHTTSSALALRLGVTPSAVRTARYRRRRAN
jgi:hypothetical protein